MSDPSLSRLPVVTREELDEQGRQAYDTVGDTNHRLWAKLVGPPGFWLHIPELLIPIREINWRIRRKMDALEPRLRELTVLVTARAHDCQYEWTAHEPYAINAGLDPAVIDVVKHRKPVAGLGEKEAAIITFGRELFSTHKMSDATYDRALRALGQKGVVQMVALMSNYAMTATILLSIGQRLRPGQVPLLPIEDKG